MPSGRKYYRGRECRVELDDNGYVEDIYPIEKGDSFVVTEDDKIAFEVEHKPWIQDVMEEHGREVAEFKRARGREMVGE